MATNVSVPIRAYRFLHRLARRRTACILAIGIFTFCFRLALSPVLRHPQPAANDEFAYLLGADIFAHSRLTEPTHPLWKFFEPVHVLSQPVYAPKYPPAQAAFMAIGQVVFKDPYYGVLLSVALFAAAVFWMLQAYVAPAWALLGGVCIALYFGAGHYWTETYWGGAVPALGAALLIGAFGRLIKLQRPYCGIVFGLGALVLLCSRPYESSFLILILSSVLAVAYCRKRHSIRFGWLAPTALSLAAVPLLLLAYNYGVTGNALQMPYTLHMQQYTAVSPFWFMREFAPKHYQNAAVEWAYRGFELMTYHEITSLSAFDATWRNLLTILITNMYDGGTFWIVPLLFVPLLWRDSTIRLFACCGIVLTAALTVEVLPLLHYMAPLLVVGTLLCFAVLDRLWRFRGRKCADRILLACVIVAAMLTGPLWRAANAMAGSPGQLYHGEGFNWKRADTVRAILSHPGSHVVFVHYTPGKYLPHQWVANGANIDSARLIWAHDRGSENRELQDYFKGRTFWIMDDNVGLESLAPYPGTPPQAAFIPQARSKQP